MSPRPRFRIVGAVGGGAGGGERGIEGALGVDALGCCIWLRGWVEVGPMLLAWRGCGASEEGKGGEGEAGVCIVCCGISGDGDCCIVGV